tara:strand:+ start:272 stop:505 length:234 start_codon:yes stop_codon:yes gene_type:complete
MTPSSLRGSTIYLIKKQPDATKWQNSKGNANRNPLLLSSGKTVLSGNPLGHIAVAAQAVVTQHGADEIGLSAGITLN